jgi:hypothetical protein
METRQQYDWNYAEQEESEAAQEAQRALMLESWPDLPIYISALSGPLTTETFRPNLSATTPEGFDDTPANLGFLACCMLNPNAQHAQDWIEWAVYNLKKSELSQLAIIALEQIRLNHGPISLLQPDLLKIVIQIIRDHAPETLWPSIALVNLFQPIDVGMELAEDALYAPTCKTLLASGANSSFRDLKGHSALSGLNQLLTESEVSMAKPSKMMDLMLCAELLLDSGASPDMVRPMPPLESLVSNDNFRWMLLSRVEKEALSQYDKEHIAQHTMLAPKKTSTRL